MERLSAHPEKSAWPVIEPDRVCPAELKDAPVQRLMFCDTPAFLVLPQGKPAGVLVSFDDRGKEALADDPAIRDALTVGWSVAGIDPRGMGERATAQTGWIGASSLLLGDYFVARQAADVLSVIRAFHGQPVALYARGVNAGLIAALVLNQQPVKWFAVRDSFLSFRQFLDRPKSLAESYRLRSVEAQRRLPYDREIPLFFVPFQALERPDIPALFAKSPGVVVNPVNGDWERMEQSQARKLVPQATGVIVAEAPEGALRDFIAVHSTR